MHYGKFILLVLAGMGLFPFTYFIVKWSRKLFYSFNQLYKKISSDDVITDLGDAYEEESEAKARKANGEFAYSKLLVLSTTKTKSYRQRVSDLKAVKEFHLPANETLLKVLSDVLKNQSSTEHEIRYEVLSYLFYVKEIISGRIFSWSVWLTILAMTTCLFSAKLLDLFSMSQLLLMVFLLLFFAFLPIIIVRNGWRKKISVFILVLIVLVLSYLAGYSYLYHVMLPQPPPITVMRMQIEYPAWIINSGIPNRAKSDQCEKPIIIKAVDDGTGPVSIPEIKIVPNSDTSLFDKDCNPLPAGDTVTVGSTTKTAFLYYVAPSDRSNSFNQYSLGVTVTFDKTTNSLITIQLEHSFWYWSRLGLGILIGAIFIGGILSGISQWFKDQITNSLGTSGNKR